MRTTMKSIVTLLLFVAGAPLAAAAPDLTGVWQSVDAQSGKPSALIRITEHNGEYVGHIERLLREPGQNPEPRCVNCKGALKDVPIVGLPILTGLRRKEGGYGGGTILDPEGGSSYDCEVSLAADGQRLHLRGYVGIPAFGRSFVWYRAQ